MITFACNYNYISNNSCRRTYVNMNGKKKNNNNNT